MVELLLLSSRRIRFIAVLLASCLAVEPVAASVAHNRALPDPVRRAVPMALFRQEALVARLPTDTIQAYNPKLFDRAILTPAVGYLRQVLNLPRRMSRSRVIRMATTPQALGAVAGIAGVMKAVSASAERVITPTAGVAQQTAAAVQAQFTQISHIEVGARLLQIMKLHHIPPTQANLDAIQTFNELMGTGAVKTIGEQSHLLIAGKNLLLPFDPLAAPTTVINDLAVHFASGPRPDLLPTVNVWMTPDTWMIGGIAVAVVGVVSAFLLIRSMLRHGAYTAVTQRMARGRELALTQGALALGMVRVGLLNLSTLHQSWKTRKPPVLEASQPARVTVVEEPKPKPIPEEPEDSMRIFLGGDPIPVPLSPRQGFTLPRGRLRLDIDEETSQRLALGDEKDVVEILPAPRPAKRSRIAKSRLTAPRLKDFRKEWRAIRFATYSSAAKAIAARQSFVELLQPYKDTARTHNLKQWQAFIKSVEVPYVATQTALRGKFTLVEASKIKRPATRRTVRKPKPAAVIPSLVRLHYAEPTATAVTLPVPKLDPELAAEPFRLTFDVEPVVVQTAAENAVAAVRSPLYPFVGYVPAEMNDQINDLLKLVGPPFHVNGFKLPYPYLDQEEVDNTKLQPVEIVATVAEQIAVTPVAAARYAEAVARATALADVLKTVLAPLAKDVTSKQYTRAELLAELDAIEPLIAVKSYASQELLKLQLKGLREKILAMKVEDAVSADAAPTPTALDESVPVMPTTPVVAAAEPQLEDGDYTTYVSREKAKMVVPEQGSARPRSKTLSTSVRWGVLATGIAGLVIWAAPVSWTVAKITPLFLMTSVGSLLVVVAGGYGVYKFMNREQLTDDQKRVQGFKNILGDQPKLTYTKPASVRPAATRPATTPAAPAAEKVVTASGIELPKQAKRTPVDLHAELMGKLKQLALGLDRLDGRGLTAAAFESFESQANRLLRDYRFRLPQSETFAEELRFIEATRTAYRARLTAAEQTRLTGTSVAPLKTAPAGKTELKGVKSDKTQHGRTTEELTQAVNALRNQVEADTSYSLDRLAEYVYAWREMRNEKGYDQYNIPFYQAYGHASDAINAYEEKVKVNGKQVGLRSILMRNLLRSADLLRSIDLASLSTVAQWEAHLNEIILQARELKLIDETRKERLLEKKELTSDDQKHAVAQAVRDVRVAIEIMATVKDADQRGTFDLDRSNRTLIRQHRDRLNAFSPQLERFLDAWPVQKQRLQTLIQDQLMQLAALEASLTAEDVAVKPVEQPSVTSAGQATPFGGRFGHRLPASPNLSSEKGSSAFIITGVFGLVSLLVITVGANAEDPIRATRDLALVVVTLLGVGAGISLLYVFMREWQRRLTENATGLKSPLAPSTRPVAAVKPPVVRTAPVSRAREASAAPAASTLRTDATFWNRFEALLKPLQESANFDKSTTYFAVRDDVKKYIAAMQSGLKVTPQDYAKADARLTKMLGTYLTKATATVRADVTEKIAKEARVAGARAEAGSVLEFPQTSGAASASLGKPATVFTFPKGRIQESLAGALLSLWLLPSHVTAAVWLVGLVVTVLTITRPSLRKPSNLQTFRKYAAAA